jgi:hypothetical protein
MKTPMPNRTLLVALLITGMAPLGMASAKKPKAAATKAAPVAAAALGEEQLRPLLAEFLDPGADTRALTDRFKPTPQDLAAVFDPTVLPRVDAYYASAWSREVIAPRSGEVELQIHKATTDDLLAGTPPSKEFPLGWRTGAKGVKKGLTFYAFRYLKPGTKESSLFDALVPVNGHFVYLPKVWLAVK